MSREGIHRKEAKIAKENLGGKASFCDLRGFAVKATGYSHAISIASRKIAA